MAGDFGMLRVPLVAEVMQHARPPPGLCPDNAASHIPVPVQALPARSRRTKNADARCTGGPFHGSFEQVLQISFCGAAALTSAIDLALEALEILLEHVDSASAPSRRRRPCPARSCAGSGYAARRPAHGWARPARNTGLGGNRPWRASRPAPPSESRRVTRIGMRRPIPCLPPVQPVLTSQQSTWWRRDQFTQQICRRLRAGAGMKGAPKTGSRRSPAARSRPSRCRPPWRYSRRGSDTSPRRW